MKLVVVGGHSRNIGKTSVAAAVIAATREMGWTALKLTQFGHNLCSADGRPCDCAVTDPLHPFAITRETDAGGASDTSRFLAAGALDAYWVRTPVGGLSAAMPEILGLVSSRRSVIMESNSILRFMRPDFYVVVLDPNTADFKPSARQNLDRADAFIMAHTSEASRLRFDNRSLAAAAQNQRFGTARVSERSASRSANEPAFADSQPAPRMPAWENVPLSLIERRPVFHVVAPDYFPPEMMPLLKAKLERQSDAAAAPLR